MTAALALFLQAIVAFYGTGFTADPCASEDTVPTVRACYWDAAQRGNGTGESFIVFPGGYVFVTEYAS